MTSADIKRRAAELGFDLCGIAPVGDFPELAFLPEWLRRGHAGRMTYLNRTASKRVDVRRWLPSARSVVVVACFYHTDRPHSTEVSDPGVAKLSRYCWGDDYHDVLGGRLEALLTWMRDASADAFEARIGVDDVPIQERVYAARAGLGWVGRNTCVINPDLGSWFVLGEIVTSLELEPDRPVFDQCGTCRLCLEACPTGALVEPGMLDARRCLSYLTIEIRKSIPVESRPDLGSHVFGCDICQDVCPYNATARSAADPVWQPRAGLDQPRLVDLWRASDVGLGARIEGTALRRRGVGGLRRNIAVALGNGGLRDAVDVLRGDPRPDAPTVLDPVVAEHVTWAIERLERQ